MNVSVIILTVDEAQDLPRCLEALQAFDDVHVLDSGSTDNTRSIAEAAGCHVSQRPFDSFGKQRNFALHSMPLKHEWVLFLDADEVATPDFIAAVEQNTTSAAQDIAGYYCCWKTMLDGVWLKRCDSFPKWQFRLLRRERADFTDFGHGQKEGRVDGVLGFIRTPYKHYSISKGWEVWLEKHRRYAQQEAQARVSGKAKWGAVFSASGSERNRAIKIKLGQSRLFPIIRFLTPYVLNLGFLEGKPGLTYCRNLATYEMFVYREIQKIRAD